MNNFDFKPFFTDSLTSKKLSLPLPPDSDIPINIYACGITPYSDAHIGHARSYIVFDLLAKIFLHAGYKTRLVRNITDIDDKIIKAAESYDMHWFELSEYYARKSRELMLETGLYIPMEPKASDYLEDIFKLIWKLLEMGHAYISNGDVLYSVESYKGHLLMNHKEGSLKSQHGETRVNGTNKTDARDFALWKSMPINEVGFDSPWGWGRPGWHIECSAMIGNIFEGHVDIHGGGVDLKFPHHQAEIMQSEPAWGKPVAKIWMHNGSVLSDGVKMSKSLNNYVTWRDALNIANKKQKDLGGDILKLALLSTHWQKPLDWKESSLGDAHELLKLISLGFREKFNKKKFEAAKRQILSMLAQNLNTPHVFAFMRSHKNNPDFPHLAQAFVNILGLKVAEPLETKVEINISGLSQEVLNLIEQRNKARLEKNWDLSDKLREKLRILGFNQNDGSSN